MKKNRVFVLFALVSVCILCLTGCTLFSFLGATEGTIQIERVSPNSSLVDGEEYEFSITVFYTLESGLGQIDITINNSDAVYDYWFIDQKVVSSSEGMETFTFDAEVKDWGAEGSLQLGTSIWGYPSGSGTNISLSTDSVILTFQ